MYARMVAEAELPLKRRDADGHIIPPELAEAGVLRLLDLGYEIQKGNITTLSKSPLPDSPCPNANRTPPDTRRGRGRGDTE